MALIICLKSVSVFSVVARCYKLNSVIQNILGRKWNYMWQQTMANSCLYIIIFFILSSLSEYISKGG